MWTARNLQKLPHFPGLESETQDPRQVTRLHRWKIFTCPWNQESLFRFHLESKGHILPTPDTFHQLHQKTSTFEGVLESEWGHHEAGWFWHEVRCFFAHLERGWKWWTLVVCIRFRHVFFLTDFYGGILALVGGQHLKHSNPSETWTCGFNSGFLKQQHVFMHLLPTAFVDIDNWSASWTHDCLSKALTTTLHFSPHGHAPWTVNHFE